MSTSSNKNLNLNSDHHAHATPSSSIKRRSSMTLFEKFKFTRKSRQSSSTKVESATASRSPPTTPDPASCLSPPSTGRQSRFLSTSPEPLSPNPSVRSIKTSGCSVKSSPNLSPLREAVVTSHPSTSQFSRSSYSVEDVRTSPPSSVYSDVIKSNSRKSVIVQSSLAQSPRTSSSGRRPSSAGAESSRINRQRNSAGSNRRLWTSGNALMFADRETEWPEVKRSSNVGLREIKQELEKILAVADSDDDPSLFNSLVDKMMDKTDSSTSSRPELISHSSSSEGRTSHTREGTSKSIAKFKSPVASTSPEIFDPNSTIKAKPRQQKSSIVQPHAHQLSSNNNTFHPPISSSASSITIGSSSSSSHSHLKISPDTISSPRFDSSTWETPLTPSSPIDPTPPVSPYLLQDGVDLRLQQKSSLSSTQSISDIEVNDNPKRTSLISGSTLSPTSTIFVSEECYDGSTSKKLTDGLLATLLPDHELDPSSQTLYTDEGNAGKYGQTSFTALPHQPEVTPAITSLEVIHEEPHIIPSERTEGLRGQGDDTLSKNEGQLVHAEDVASMSIVESRTPSLSSHSFNSASSHTSNSATKEETTQDVTSTYPLVMDNHCSSGSVETESTISSASFSTFGSNSFFFRPPPSDSVLESYVRADKRDIEQTLAESFPKLFSDGADTENNTMVLTHFRKSMEQRRRSISLHAIDTTIRAHGHGTHTSVSSVAESFDSFKTSQSHQSAMHAPSSPSPLHSVTLPYGLTSSELYSPAITPKPSFAVAVSQPQQHLTIFPKVTIAQQSADLVALQAHIRGRTNSLPFNPQQQQTANSNVLILSRASLDSSLSTTPSASSAASSSSGIPHGLSRPRSSTSPNLRRQSLVNASSRNLSPTAFQNKFSVQPHIGSPSFVATSFETTQSTSTAPDNLNNASLISSRRRSILGTIFGRKKKHEASSQTVNKSKLRDDGKRLLNLAVTKGVGEEDEVDSMKPKPVKFGEIPSSLDDRYLT